MTRRGRLAAAVTALAAAAALVAAGCGEDEAASDEFAAEVGGLCEDATQRSLEANAGLIAEDPTFSKEFREANEPIYDDYIADLEAVEPPEGKEDAYDDFVTAIREQSELLLAHPVAPLRAGLANEETAITREIAQLREDTLAAGEELGLPAACTTGSTESTPPE